VSKRRPAVAPRAARPNSEHPVARPFAPPPPESPYHSIGVALMARLQSPIPPPTGMPQRPAMAPPLPPSLPKGKNPLLGGLARHAVVIIGLMIVCMLAGWYFIQGPGAQTIGNLFASKSPKDEPPPSSVAENQPSKEPERRVDGDRKERRDEEKRNRRERSKKPDNGGTKPPPMPDPPMNTSPVMAVTLDQHVRPIFEARCLNCHGAGKKRGGLDMRTIQSMMRGGDSGSGLVAGSPDKSTIWETITNDRMPPGKMKLSAAEKKLVRDWIAGGAK
jgi:hypothetical protein